MNDTQAELAAWELLAEARRERDEAREQLTAALVRAENAEQDRVQSDTDSIRALHERNGLREQLAAERALADRLADALVDIQDRASDATIMLHPDDESKGCIDDCWEWSEQALAAWKEARK